MHKSVWRPHGELIKRSPEPLAGFKGPRAAGKARYRGGRKGRGIRDRIGIISPTSIRYTILKLTNETSVIWAVHFTGLSRAGLIKRSRAPGLPPAKYGPEPVCSLVLVTTVSISQKRMNRSRCRLSMDSAWLRPKEPYACRLLSLDWGTGHAQGTTGAGWPNWDFLLHMWSSNRLYNQL